MKRYFIVIVFATILALSCNAASKLKHPANVRPPVEVVRSFFLAMLANNEAGVQKHILPHPKADILWQGEAPPPEVLPQAKRQFANMICLEGKVGETIYLPGGRKSKITSLVVNETRKLLIPVIGGEFMPTPLFVFKVGNHWKVNAEPLITARLAAKRVREKESSNK